MEQNRVLFRLGKRFTGCDPNQSKGLSPPQATLALATENEMLAPTLYAAVCPVEQSLRQKRRKHFSTCVFATRRTHTHTWSYSAFVRPSSCRQLIRPNNSVGLVFTSCLPRLIGWSTGAGARKNNVRFWGFCVICHWPLSFRIENWHSTYSCHGNQFWFFFVFELRTYEPVHDRQTDHPTDGQAKSITRHDIEWPHYNVITKVKSSDITLQQLEIDV